MLAADEIGGAAVAVSEGRVEGEGSGGEGAFEGAFGGHPGVV